MTCTIKFSKTSKMPCSSFSLPATACKTGAKLAKIKGSVCHGCYALKGRYHMPVVINARQVNLDSLPTSEDGADWLAWADAIAAHIKATEKTGYFRWHDSGDLQGELHLSALVCVARELPNIKFWLPTKEKALISDYLRKGNFPDNLIVRVSSAMVDGEPLNFVNTSTVHKELAAHGLVCKAYTNKGKCGSCRACWDKAIPNVSYPLH